MYVIFDIEEENKNASFEYPYHIWTQLTPNNSRIILPLQKNMKYVMNKEQVQMRLTAWP